MEMERLPPTKPRTDNKTGSACAACGRSGETGASDQVVNTEVVREAEVLREIVADAGSEPADVDMEGPVKIVEELRWGARGCFDDESC